MACQVCTNWAWPVYRSRGGGGAGPQRPALQHRLRQRAAQAVDVFHGQRVGLLGTQLGQRCSAAAAGPDSKRGAQAASSRATPRRKPAAQSWASTLALVGLGHRVDRLPGFGHVAPGVVNRLQVAQHPHHHAFALLAAGKRGGLIAAPDGGQPVGARSCGQGTGESNRRPGSRPAPRR